jgi:hypothetical protein
MMPIRSTVVCALVASAALAAGAPAAGASTPFTLPAFAVPAGAVLPTAAGNPVGQQGACGTATGPQGQARTGGTTNPVCVGAGLSFVGPAIGQIATVIGPTIIGPAVVGTSIVSAGAASGP